MAELGSERQPATWRGLPAWRVASGDVWVVVCPARGAKITSLFDVRGAREWLTTAAPGELRPLTYGALWSAYEMCGWDEVFPTLGECAHPGPGRSTGVRLPDHGEVWSVPWDDETPDDGAHVVCSVSGVALPYRLRRTVRVDGPTLRLDYELTNTGEDPLPFQWVPHLLVHGTGLRLDWDADGLPWTMALNGLTVPTTADGPDLAAAVEARRARTLAPGATTHWHLTTTLSA